MNATQLKARLSKAIADPIFAMDRSSWESHAREWAAPKGWKIRVEPTANGSSVLEEDPTTGIEFMLRPYYDNDIDPPESLFVEIHYPPAKAPKFTADFKHDLEYDARRSLGPEYSVSATYATSPSFVEIELIIKKAG